MIKTDKFVFIHMHKTGGQTINNALLKSSMKSQELGYHHPSFMLDKSVTLPLVAMIRNPWDWYVSWYAFNRKLGMSNPLFIVVSDGGMVDFKTTITNLVNLGDNSLKSKQYRNALIAILPDTLESNDGVGLTKNCIRNFENNDIGYYTWLFNRMIGLIDQEQTHIGLFENLQQDFVKILDKLAVAESKEIESILKTVPAQNTSSHSHYSNYYDDELKELIANKEKEIIDKHHYSFENKSNQSACIKLPTCHANESGFRKLLGKESNFLLISNKTDVEGIRKKLHLISEEQWAESKREETFIVHKKTQTIILATDEFKHQIPEFSDSMKIFEKELQPLLKTIRNFYNNEGFFSRILLVKLFSKQKIAPHYDKGFSLLHSNRIHIPIISNSQVSFIVGGDKRNLNVNEIWEINNGTIHEVENLSSEDRVHLIVDWVPLSTFKDKKGKTTVPLKRNDPCYCGSKLKYKACHGKLT